MKALKTLLAVVAFSAVASANTVTFSTTAGATESGGNLVNASAVFTTSLNTIQIDLSNLLTAAQVNTVAQNLSDLVFSLSGSFGAVTDANRVYTGTLINVAADGSVSAGSASFNGWDFSGSGSTYTLEDLGSLAGPAQTIIGGTTGDTYGGAGGSIKNNGPHNPFILGVAHFTLTVAGVTASTNVTAATFSFGTTLGDNVTGCRVGGPTCTSTVTPEPLSSALVGTGLISLFFLRRRASKKA